MPRDDDPGGRRVVRTSRARLRHALRWLARQFPPSQSQQRRHEDRVLQSLLRQGEGGESLQRAQLAEDARRREAWRHRWSRRRRWL